MVLLFTFNGLRAKELLDTTVVFNRSIEATHSIDYEKITHITVWNTHRVTLDLAPYVNIETLFLHDTLDFEVINIPESLKAICLRRYNTGPVIPYKSHIETIQGLSSMDECRFDFTEAYHAFGRDGFDFPKYYHEHVMIHHKKTLGSQCIFF